MELNNTKMKSNNVRLLTHSINSSATFDRIIIRIYDVCEDETRTVEGKCGK